MIYLHDVFLAQAGGSAMEDLNGVFGQHATSALMVTWTAVTSGAEVVSTTGRDSKHTYTMLYGIRTTGTTETLALVMLFNILQIYVVKKKR